MRVLVRGAGVAGLAVARELCAAGDAVTGRRARGDVASGASALAGGMLAPFCEAESASEAVTRLGLAAADWWDAAVPGAVPRTGTLVVAPARDLGELARLAALTRGHAWLDADAVAALALAGRFRKGLFLEGEAHLDPRRALATAQMARDVFETNWVKLEVIGHHDTLQPDVFPLVDAAAAPGGAHQFPDEAFFRISFFSVRSDMALRRHSFSFSSSFRRFT